MAGTLRERLRAELTAEIKATARRHVAAHGASNLSLRAVARDLDMVSSALYRYFASRDELLTALIIDAYNDLGAAAEETDAEAARADLGLTERYRAVCHAVRDWALANPHLYALTYGSPVPGYAAPRDTVGPASRVAIVLIGVIVAAVRSGAVIEEAGELSPAMLAETERIRAATTTEIPGGVFARGMIAWTELFGAVSFEVFGRLNGMIEDRSSWFDHQVTVMAKLVGLPG